MRSLKRRTSTGRLAWRSRKPFKPSATEPTSLPGFWGPMPWTTTTAVVVSRVGATASVAALDGGIAVARILAEQQLGQQCRRRWSKLLDEGRVGRACRSSDPLLYSSSRNSSRLMPAVLRMLRRRPGLMSRLWTGDHEGVASFGMHEVVVAVAGAAVLPAFDFEDADQPAMRDSTTRS